MIGCVSYRLRVVSIDWVLIVLGHLQFGNQLLWVAA